MLKAAIVILGAAAVYVILVRTNTVWLLNRLMLWGAGLGLAMFFLVFDVVRVAKHRGPGYVTYGEDAEDVEKVSESDYKRHHLFNGGFVLLLVLLAWIEVARRASSKGKEASPAVDKT